MSIHFQQQNLLQNVSNDTLAYIPGNFWFITIWSIRNNASCYYEMFLVLIDDSGVLSKYGLLSGDTPMRYSADKHKMVVNFDFEVKFDLEGQGQSPQGYKDLNQRTLHHWSKFGDPGFNGSQLIARTCSGLTHGRTDARTHTGRHGQRQYRRPKLASCKHYWPMNRIKLYLIGTNDLLIVA